jgi:hypothetical protein
MSRNEVGTSDQVRVLPRGLIRERPEREHTVTVVIPCYNYGRFLGQAVESAIGQTDVSVDVVVVDDASTDDSLEIANALARAHPAVRVIARPRNGGPVDTFNDGLAAVGGEYLVRLDADDLLTPGSLGRSIALAEAFPEVGMVYGRPLHFWGEPPNARTRPSSWRVMSGSRWLDLRCRIGANCITSPEVLMRTSVVDEVGGQRPLAHAHDMEMWMRLARAADVGWVGGSDQAWHREHLDSRSSLGVDVITDLGERAAAFETLFTDGRGDAARDAVRLETARSALADDALRRASSAYARGRGGSPETDAYLRFAGGLDVDLARLPHAKVFAQAERLGPRRARYSPSLLGWAAINRIKGDASARRWARTGL